MWAPIAESRFLYAECAPYEYIDFEMDLNQAENSNMMVEVEDLETTLVTDALGLYVYQDAIPQVRENKVFCTVYVYASQFFSFPPLIKLGSQTF